MLPKRVKLREVGPREGLQTTQAVIETSKKLELIQALNATGVLDIELTSLVRPDKVPQMADADVVIQQYERKQGVNYTALYLNPKGFERGEASGRLDNEAWLFVATSEAFLKKNNDTTLAALYAEIPEWLAVFKKANKKLHGLMVSTAFGCNYEGKISVEKLMQVLEKVSHILVSQSEKLHEICLADTMGWASPEMLKERVRKVRERFAHVDVSLHLHDTRGTGLANVYAGLQEGVACFDASVGGMGGCPFANGATGNVATEDVIHLCEELGIETGLDLKAYAKAARLAEKLLGVHLPGKLMRLF